MRPAEDIGELTELARGPHTYTDFSLTDLGRTFLAACPAPAPSVPGHRKRLTGRSAAGQPQWFTFAGYISGLERSE